MKRVMPILFCAFIGLSLLITEIITGVFYKKTYSLIGWDEIIQPDEKLVYSLRPNLDAVRKLNETEMKFHIDNLGFRNVSDIETPKSPDTFRILMAGDSFTFGYTLSDEETIPYIVKKRITEASVTDRRVEVINMGVPGYSPDQSYRQLVDTIPRLQPDLVIWSFISWQINGMVNFTSEGYYRPSLYTIDNKSLTYLDARWNNMYISNRLFTYAPPVIRHSYLYDLIINRLYYSPVFSGIPRISRDDRLVWAENKLGMEITNMYKYTRDNNSDFLFVVLPTQDGLTFNTNGEYLAFISNVKGVVHDISPVSFIDLNFPLLAQEIENKKRSDVFTSDILGETTQDQKKILFQDSDGHPSSRGAQLFAELLMPHILEKIQNYLN